MNSVQMESVLSRAIIIMVVSVKHMHTVSVFFTILCGTAQYHTHNVSMYVVLLMCQGTGGPKRDI